MCALTCLLFCYYEHLLNYLFACVVLFLTVIYFVLCMSVKSSLELCCICCFNLPTLNKTLQPIRSQLYSNHQTHCIIHTSMGTRKLIIDLTSSFHLWYIAEWQLHAEACHRKQVRDLTLISLKTTRHFYDKDNSVHLLR